MIKGLPGVFKLFNNLLIGGRDHAHLAERVERLLKRCQEAGMTLASNKVQVGKKVSFAGYMINGSTQYVDPKMVEAVTKFPRLKNIKELRGWLGMCNRLKHYVPGLAGEQPQFRKLLKKGEPFIIT